jgi:predicted TIM-barrel fold metal-dependent hydrolase
MNKPKTIDVHAHFLPPVYQEALRDAGLKTLDGGIPTSTWSPERALAIMDEVGITGAVLSVSSPHLNFVDPARAAALSRSINDYAAEIKRRHPDRFGAYAILPLRTFERVSQSSTARSISSSSTAWRCRCTRKAAISAMRISLRCSQRSMRA